MHTTLRRKDFASTNFNFLVVFPFFDSLYVSIEVEKAELLSRKRDATNTLLIFRFTIPLCLRNSIVITTVIL